MEKHTTSRNKNKLCKLDKFWNNEGNLQTDCINCPLFHLTLVNVQQINSHDSRQTLQLRCQNGKPYAFTGAFRAGIHLKTNIHGAALNFSMTLTFCYAAIHNIIW